MTDAEFEAQKSHGSEAECERLRAELDKWLAWSGGRYPDTSPGTVIHAKSDGTIILDDGVTTWNPLRALAWWRRKDNDLSSKPGISEGELWGRDT